MSSSGARPYRRRKWVVNRPLQFRFVKAMLLVLCLMAVAGLSAIYVSIWVTVSSFELSHDPVIVSLLSTVSWTIALALLLMAPAVICLGILLTHKVAGPLVRIHAALTQMANGNFDVHMTLRKGDELIELAETVNYLAAFLRRRAS